jgi:adenine-specific DNA methylase
MASMIHKKAGLEEANLTDPRTNLPIRVSTTVRLKYRKYFDERFTHRDVLYDLNNKELNEIIAQDFAVSHDLALHMFLSKSSNIESKKREWVEIRQVSGRSAFNYFFSIIRPDSIDIITTSTRYIKPRKSRLFVPKF